MLATTIFKGIGLIMVSVFTGGVIFLALQGMTSFALDLLGKISKINTIRKLERNRAEGAKISSDLKCWGIELALDKTLDTIKSTTNSLQKDNTKQKLYETFRSLQADGEKKLLKTPVETPSAIQLPATNPNPMQKQAKYGELAKKFDEIRVAGRIAGLSITPQAYIKGHYYYGSVDKDITLQEFCNQHHIDVTIFAVIIDGKAEYDASRILTPTNEISILPYSGVALLLLNNREI